MSYDPIEIETDRFTGKCLKYTVHFDADPGFPGNREEPPEPPDWWVEDIELAGWSCISFMTDQQIEWFREQVGEHLNAEAEKAAAQYEDYCEGVAEDRKGDSILDDWR